MKSLLTDILSPFPYSSNCIDSAEFSHSVYLARRNNMEMLFYARLKKHFAGKSNCVDDYLQRYEKSYLLAVARSMRQEAVEKDIVAVLNKEGIAACIIKGNELARTVYDDPNCRSSSDVDVLVKQSDFYKADLSLRDANYTPDQKILFADFMYHTHHKGYHDSKFNIPIEIHWRFGVPYFFKLSSDEIWNGIVIDDKGHAKLSPTMLLVILLIHHHFHSFRELRVLVDLLWFFCKYDSAIDWSGLTLTLRRIGLTKTTLITINQLEDIWSERISSLKSIKSLKHSLADTGFMGTTYLAEYFRMDLNAGSTLNFYKDKFIARIALDGLDTIFLSYWKTIFPPAEVIQKIYHSNSNLMLPMNYMRFISTRVTYWMGLTKG